MAEELRGQFSKEDLTMANRHMRRYLTLLIIREMQIKSTMRYHLMLAGMAPIEKVGDHRCHQGWDEKETLRP